MKNEKLAAILLVIIIVGSVSVFLAVTYGEDIIGNLFGKKTDKISFGDCADVNYIGRYANDTIFASSYNNTATKTGGIPLNVFVTLNSSETPPNDYSSYSNMIGQNFVEGFMEGLVGLEAKQKATIGPLTPDKAYGYSPRVGDVINLTRYVDTTYVFRITEIHEDVLMPSDFSYYGNITTSLYLLREDWHYVGEIIQDNYPSWPDSTVVTKINDTLLWKYTTPTYDIGEDFTWISIDSFNSTETEYPENSSSISLINDTTIIVTHTPQIGTMINEHFYYPEYGYISTTSYVVENVTAEKINTSITDSTGNKTYRDFDRTTTIQRNETQTITLPILPGEYLEENLFSYIRGMDKDFNLGYGPLADKTVYFDVEIVNVYKSS